MQNKFAFAFFLTILIFPTPLITEAQNPQGNYNPFVNSATITPAPIWPVEANGTGTLSFNVGNTGKDPLDVFVGNQIKMTIKLSSGVPDNADPLLALGGSFLNMFSWSYSQGTYTATQISTIPANLSGTITIAYKVTKNSVKGNPTNGFTIKLTPAQYQTTSNSTKDDAASSFTWTEIRDFGDAPASYGSADHIIDFKNILGHLIDGEMANQPSAQADGDDTHGIDDEEGVVFPTLTAGTKATIQVTITGSGYLNAWIDWNGNGNFNDAADRIASNIQVSNEIYNLQVSIPANAITTAPTFARFRLGPRSTLNPSYNSTGSAAFGEVEDYMITILCAPPAIPVVGSIVQPTCVLATGSVVLNNLPSQGAWILTVLPSGNTISGSGSSYTVSALSSGTYTFIVTNSSACTSQPTADVVINPQPPSPPGPSQSIDCSQDNQAVVTVTSPLGQGLVYRLDGGTFQASPIFSAVTNGTHNITVQNANGCSTTGPDFQVLCNCVNPPEITLSSVSGSLCGTLNPVTVSGNTFGGSATNVTITANGVGSVSPSSSGTSPFSFTYTPGNGDTDKQVIITVTSDNPLGSPCQAKTVTYTLSVSSSPAPPVTGNIIQPTCFMPGGSVTLSGLPTPGTWTITRNPGSVNSTGTGSETNITGLPTGTFTFTVTSAAGCISGNSANVIILPNPDAPKVTIKNPDAVCAPDKVDITASSITAGSTAGLTYTYFTDRAGTISYNTPKTATSGTYYIKGTDATLCYDIEPVVVTVLSEPTVNAGPDQVLEYQYSANLNANDPGINETGQWKILAGSGKINDVKLAKTVVNDLAAGRNIFLWTVTNGVCPASDSVTITVQDIQIPGLITPNNDGRNDYFVIRGLESQGKTELIIFDRNGLRLFVDESYENKWNGVDINGKILPDDTYFYVVKSGNGRSHTGFIVIRH